MTDRHPLNPFSLSQLRLPLTSQTNVISSSAFITNPKIRRKESSVSNHLKLNSSGDGGSPHSSIYDAEHFSEGSGVRSASALSPRIDPLAMHPPVKRAITAPSGQGNDFSTKLSENAQVIDLAECTQAGQTAFYYGQGTQLSTIMERNSRSTIRTKASTTVSQSIRGLPRHKSDDNLSSSITASHPHLVRRQVSDIDMNGPSPTPSPTRRPSARSFGNLQEIRADYHDAVATIHGLRFPLPPKHIQGTTSIYARPHTPIVEPVERPGTPPGLPSWDAVQVGTGIAIPGAVVTRRSGWAVQRKPSRFERFIGYRPTTIQFSDRVPIPEQYRRPDSGVTVFETRQTVDGIPGFNPYRVPRFRPQRSGHGFSGGSEFHPWARSTISGPPGGNLTISRSGTHPSDFRGFLASETLQDDKDAQANIAVQAASPTISSQPNLQLDMNSSRMTPLRVFPPSQRRRTTRHVADNCVVSTANQSPNGVRQCENVNDVEPPARTRVTCKHATRRVRKSQVNSGVSENQELELNDVSRNRSTSFEIAQQIASAGVHRRNNTASLVDQSTLRAADSPVNCMPDSIIPREAITTTTDENNRENGRVLIISQNPQSALYAQSTGHGVEAPVSSAFSDNTSEQDRDICWRCRISEVLEKLSKIWEDPVVECWLICCGKSHIDEEHFSGHRGSARGFVGGLDDETSHQSRVRSATNQIIGYDGSSVSREARDVRSENQREARRASVRERWRAERSAGKIVQTAKIGSKKDQKDQTRRKGQYNRNRRHKKHNVKDTGIGSQADNHNVQGHSQGFANSEPAEIALTEERNLGVAHNAKPAAVTSTSAEAAGNATRVRHTNTSSADTGRAIRETVRVPRRSGRTNGSSNGTGGVRVSTSRRRPNVSSTATGTSSVARRSRHTRQSSSSTYVPFFVPLCIPPS